MSFRILPITLLGATFVLGLLGTLAARPASAMDLPTFSDRLDAAMAHYRVAASYLRTGNVALATLEIEDLSAKFAPLAAEAGREPPPELATNPLFGSTLAETTRRIGEARALVDAGQPLKARQALLPIRDAHYAMRAKSGLRRLSDCILEVNRLAEPLHVFRRDEPDLTDAAQRNAVTAAAAAYDAALARCDVEAEAATKSSGEFRRLVDTARSSLAALPGAVAARNNGLLYRYLIELVSIDRLLFMRYG